MYEIVFKVFFLIILLPYTIAKEGWQKFKKFLDKKQDRKRLFWWYLPHIILIVLVIVLLVLLSMGYPY